MASSIFPQSNLRWIPLGVIAILSLASLSLGATFPETAPVIGVACSYLSLITIFYGARMTNTRFWYFLLWVLLWSFWIGAAILIIVAVVGVVV